MKTGAVNCPAKNGLIPLLETIPCSFPGMMGTWPLPIQKAMELAGINASTVSPDGGVLVKNAKGEPTGIFKDAAMNLIIKVIPEPTKAQLDQYFDAAAQHAVERGITHVNDMNSYGGWNDLETYRRAAGTDRMILRMYSFVPLATWEKLDSFVQKNGTGDDMLKWGGLKGYVDGSLGSTTAWFHQPYLDDPHSHGLNITDTNLLRKMGDGCGQGWLACCRSCDW